MRNLMLGTVTAATMFVAPQAMAQVGFYVGPGGAGVELGGPPVYDEYYAPRFYARPGVYYRNRWGYSDSYRRWRGEGYPYFKTDR
jgi:hypothetical protein